MRHLSAAVAIIVAATLIGSCEFEELKENQKALERQQIEIAEQQRQITSLSQQRSYPTTPEPPGTCDPEVMRHAMKRGSQRYESGEYKKAVGYFSDAVRACPDNGEAEFNLARAYEAAHEPSEARDHYEKASRAPDSKISQSAQDALSRLGRNR